MGVNVDIRNGSGSGTLVLLPGGDVQDDGIVLQPVDDAYTYHPDYKDFIQNVLQEVSRLVIVSGEDMPEMYQTYLQNTDLGQKPILVGHSAGGFVGFELAKNPPLNQLFSQILLFNVPFVNPFVGNLALRTCLTNMKLIPKGRVLVIMSKFDSKLTEKNFPGITAAIQQVEDSGNITLRTYDADPS